MDKDTGSTHSLSKRKRYQSTKLKSLGKQKVTFWGPKKSHTMPKRGGDKLPSKSQWHTNENILLFPN